MLDKTLPDVPGGTIVGVQVLPTLQALELVTIAVILVREHTFAVTAPLRRVRRCNIVHADAVLFGLVFDVALEFAERLLLELRGIRDTLTDVFQILECNRSAVVLDGLLNNRL